MKMSSMNAATRQLKPASLLPTVVSTFQRSVASASMQAERGSGASLQRNTPDSDKIVNSVIKKKTMAEIDDEMKRAMEGIAGDGGQAGLELEDGKPVAMKRGVRENMFRYI